MSADVVNITTAREGEEPARSLALTRASSIKTRRQKWAWEDRIPLGTTTIFGGNGGEGKSTFALYIAAEANHGRLAGDLYGIPCPVLIVSHEDDWATVMKPRLIGAGADTDLIYRVNVRMSIDDITAETVPALPVDLTLIRQAVTETGARLLIIDPITSTIDGDLHKVADVRRALDPLTQLAQELEIAVIAIMHFRKGAGNISEKLSGSHGFRDAVRSVLLFATDEESEKRIVTLDKSNYSKDRGASFAFNLRSETITTDDGERTSVGAVDYLGNSDISVSDIINRDSSGDDRGGSELDSAVQWLRESLEAAGGSAPAKEIVAAAKEGGFSNATIQRAGEQICEKKSTGFHKPWVWTLIQGSQQGSQGSQGSKAENLANLGSERDGLDDEEPF